MVHKKLAGQLSMLNKTSWSIRTGSTKVAPWSIRKGWKHQMGQPAAVYWGRQTTKCFTEKDWVTWTPQMLPGELFMLSRPHTAIGFKQIVISMLLADEFNTTLHNNYVIS